ncbi:MAG TPA: hypothetical protein VHD87_15080 [Acidimicrobiales bacterium]|nr:hypothetical protein [Acidimicrobiales bacterium]
MLSTLNHRGAPAEVCRANGWGPGTCLVGDEGYGPTVIEITAVGERCILAKCLGHNGVAVNQPENSWVLDARDWTEAAPADIPRPFAAGTRVVFVVDGADRPGVVGEGPDGRGGYRVTGSDGRQWAVRGDALRVAQ